MFYPASYKPDHFVFSFADKVATITLNRPERKNPLTFDSYAELRDLFRGKGITQRFAFMPALDCDIARLGELDRGCRIVRGFLGA